MKKNKSKLFFLIFLLTFFIADRIHSAEIMTDKNKCISDNYMRFCSDDDLDNTEVMMAKIKKNNFFYGDLQDLSPRLKNDYNLVKAAVLSDARHFRHASKELHDNEDIFLAAVTNRYNESGMVLEYASENLRNNEKIVLAAFSNHGAAL